MRDVELFFVDKARLTVVSSQEEAEAVRRYRPEARVRSVGGRAAGEWDNAWAAGLAGGTAAAESVQGTALATSP